MLKKTFLILVANFLLLSACSLMETAGLDEMQPVAQIAASRSPSGILGAAYFSDPNRTISKGAGTYLSMGVNIGTYSLGAYGFTITYDPTYLQVDTSKGKDGVEAIKPELGTSGFFAVNSATAGTVRIGGYITAGVVASYGGLCSMFKIYFTARNTAGTSAVTPRATLLVTSTLGDPQPIGYPSGGQPPAGAGINITVN